METKGTFDKFYWYTKDKLKYNLIFYDNGKRYCIGVIHRSFKPNQDYKLNYIDLFINKDYRFEMTEKDFHLAKLKAELKALEFINDIKYKDLILCEIYFKHLREKFEYKS